MLIHYLTLTWRNIIRRAGFSLINLLGLAVGLTAFIFLLQYVSFEWGYNQAFHHLDQVHRVLMTAPEKTNPLSPPALAPAAQEAIPGVQGFARLLDGFSGSVIIPGENDQQQQIFTEPVGQYADGQLFDVLGYPLTSGTAPTAPYTVAIAESTAQTYFGQSDPIGQAITLHNHFGKATYTVSGIFPDLPAQSDYQFELLFSIKAFENVDALNQQGWAWLGHWDSWVYTTLLRLSPEADPAIVIRQLSTFQEKLPSSFDGNITLQPLTDLHLGGGPQALIPSAVNAGYIRFFLLLGLLIIAIAWINYVNLSVARSLQRIQSIGMQKIVGASGRQIWGQYLVEAVSFNLIALLVSVTAVLLLQPSVNGLIERPLSLGLLGSSWLVGGALAFLLSGALVSGVYVAAVLSAFHPIDAVKGLIRRPERSDWVRRGMVIFQFAISTALIIGTLFMYQQLRFMQQSDLGTDLEQVILIPGPRLSDIDQHTSVDGLRQTLESRPYIQTASFSGLSPGGGYNFQAPELMSEHSLPDDRSITYASASIDQHYFDLYDIEIIAGRNLRAEEVAQNNWFAIQHILINETAAHTLRFKSPEEAVGQQVTWWNEKEFEIIGVVADHHHMGLQEAIKPMVYLGSASLALLSVKVTGQELEDYLADLGLWYTQYFPADPFTYSFADEQFAQQYADQQRSLLLFGLACGLAIFIACLGLYGLSVAAVRQRTQEVGIRRVLGATASQLVLLLSRDYLVQVVLAFIVAAPLVSYFLHRWLEDFAYHIQLEWWVYVTGGILVILLAFFTVGTQSLRAALANPVDSLRRG